MEKKYINEIWKPIKGYEGLYEVSNLGRIKSLNYNHTGKEKILKPTKDRYGYLQVTLCKNNIKKQYTVHRLVAEAFIDNPDNLPQVNHKDENKQNNNVDNLEWCDAKYNSNYGTGIERRAKSRQIPIIQYTLDGEFVREWDSAIQAEREGGFSNSHIIAVCKGKRPHHKGYIWRYKNPSDN